MDGNARPGSALRLAVATTLFCLLGCGLGKIAGLLLGYALGLNLYERVSLEVVLAFVFGFILGLVPLMRAGLGLRPALSAVAATDGLSIAAMESAELAFELAAIHFAAPGLLASRHWLLAAPAMLVGFLGAFPVNYLMVRKGLRAVQRGSAP